MQVVKLIKEYCYSNNFWFKTLDLKPEECYICYAHVLQLTHVTHGDHKD